MNRAIAVETVDHALRCHQPILRHDQCFVGLGSGREYRSNQFIFQWGRIMRSGFNLFYIFPLIFGVVTLFSLVLGLRGILTKQPFLISSRWLFSLLLIGWLPMLLQPLLMPTFSSVKGQFWAFSLIPWFQFSMFIILLIFAWIALQGYMVYGITDASFREGLIHTLEKLEIPFEENLSGIYLSSMGANLRIAIQSWIGTAQITVRPRQFNGVLRDIVQGMSSYYQTANVSLNLTTCYFYLILGAFLMIFTVIFFKIFSQFR
jgi:hypothetical protein